MRIAIVGAGLAGLVVAEKLKSSDLDLTNVDIFEKSRGVGGRLATRYHDQFVFDHGAPFFTVRSEYFRQWLAPKVRAGLIAEWNPKVVSLEKGKKSFKRHWFEPHYVASGKMSSLGKVLASGHDGQIFQQKQVVSLGRDRHRHWFLELDKGEEQKGKKRGEVKGPYDILILAIPGPQANDLLSQSLPELSALTPSAAGVSLKTFSDPDFFGRHQIVVDPMAPEYTLMLGFNDLNLDCEGVHWQLAKVSNSFISWISFENSKPGRHDQAYTLGKTQNCKSMVVRSTSEWAQKNLSLSPEYVEIALVNELSELIGFNVPQPDFSRLHRWMYAQSSSEYLQHKKNVNTAADALLSKEKSGVSIYDSELGLGICGDWLMSGNVESAFLSADNLFEQVVKYAS